MNSVQLRKEKYDLVKKSRQILERAGNRELNTEENSEYEKMQAALDELSKRIERLESLEKQEAEGEPEDKSRDEEDGDEDERSFNAPRQKRTTSKLWLAQPEGDEKRGLASSEYTKAFSHYLRTGKVQREFRDFSVTGGDGAGSLITPTKISDDFVTFLNNYTFVRNLAHVEYVNDAQSLGNPRLTSDVADADWTAEVPEDDISSDTSGAMDRRDLTPALLTKLEKISIRELMLSSKVEGIVMERLAYKFAVSEEKAFLLGDGTTNGQPLGVFTASSP